MTKLYAAVGLGAAIGSMLRYLVAVAFIFGADASALWATGFVNVTGSLAIGLFATLSAEGGRLDVSGTTRQFVMAGLCGGFTTFSIMSLDAFILILSNDMAGAILYLCASILASLAGVWAGYRLGRTING